MASASNEIKISTRNTYLLIEESAELLKKGNVNEERLGVFVKYLKRWVSARASMATKSVKEDLVRSGRRKLQVDISEFQRVFDKLMKTTIKSIFNRLSVSEKDGLQEHLGSIVLCNPRKKSTNKLHFCRVVVVRHTDYLSEYLKAFEDKKTFKTGATYWIKDYPLSSRSDGKVVKPIEKKITAIKGSENILEVEPIICEDGSAPEVPPVGHHSNASGAYRVHLDEVELSSFEDVMAAFVIRHNSDYETNDK